MISESRKNPYIPRKKCFPRQKTDHPPKTKLMLYIKLVARTAHAWNYIGETGRAFNTRKKEHVRNVKQFKDGSNIAKHAWSNDHKIDFENSKIIDKGNYRHRSPSKVGTPRLQLMLIITRNICLNNTGFF